ncbi:YrrS family protein [Bacillus cereus group sp. N11]|uniref:YrrS family protein n=1 Tax=Bacillus cereus group sp. N11 TaxID=2794585 RepID=UPI0018F3D17E|nr:YrrS family protein [Bacillus cereus group sp. N11]MBJ8097660.1 YrrS family protein [Bacillus cereus group sp. N11]
MGQVSRFQEKQQNRRKKVIFNIAFTLVLVTVSIVTYQLFSPSDTSKQAIAQKKKATKIEEKKGKEKEAAQLEEKKREEKEAAQLEEKEREEREAALLEEKKREEREAALLEEKKNEEKEAVLLEEKQKAEKSVSQEKGSQTNPSWKPIGTKQGAKPEMKFKEGTVDWNEMKEAISYAVDVPEGQLIFEFIGNNGNNKAYGNIRDKQSNKKYKVDIDWVENQGWKPVSVQVVK